MGHDTKPDGISMPLKNRQKNKILSAREKRITRFFSEIFFAGLGILSAKCSGVLCDQKSRGLFNTYNELLIIFLGLM